MWTKVEDRIWQDENGLYHSNGADGQTWVAWDIETALGGGVIWLVHQQISASMTYCLQSGDIGTNQK